MLTVERSVERATCDVCHLPEVGGTGHKVEQEACPLTDTVVGEEQGGREYQQVRNCFEIDPRRDGRANCRWDSLAFD